MKTCPQIISQNLPNNCVIILPYFKIVFFCDIQMSNISPLNLLQISTKLRYCLIYHLFILFYFSLCLVNNFWQLFAILIQFTNYTPHPVLLSILVHQISFINRNKLLYYKETHLLFHSSMYFLFSFDRGF